MITVAAGVAALLCLLPVLVAGLDVFDFYAVYARGFLAERAGGTPPPEPIYSRPTVSWATSSRPCAARLS